MAIYFFDIFDGHEVIRDGEGQELHSVSAVRAEAEEAVRELIAQTLARKDPIGHRELRVRDVFDVVVLVQTFRDLLDRT